MTARDDALEAARLVALRHLQQRRAEAVHAEAERTAAASREAREAAAKAHAEDEEAWQDSLQRPETAFGCTAAWGALLLASHGRAREARSSAAEAETARAARAAESCAAAAVAELAQALSDRLDRKLAHHREERSLAAYEDMAAGRRNVR